MVRAVLKLAWSKSKSRRKMIPMKLRRGVHIPWGAHERFAYYATNAFGIYLLLLLSFITYLMLTGQ